MINETANATTTYLVNALGTSGLASWMPMCIIIMVGIFLMLFLLYKTLRWSLIGSGISGLGLIVFKVAEYISKQSTTGNTIPLNWFLEISIFLAISIIIGIILQNTKWGEKLDKEIGNWNEKAT
jgi:preprotein translocase subunit SecG